MMIALWGRSVLGCACLSVSDGPNVYVAAGLTTGENLLTGLVSVLMLLAAGSVAKTAGRSFWSWGSVAYLAGMALWRGLPSLGVAAPVAGMALTCLLLLPAAGAVDRFRKRQEPGRHSAKLPAPVRSARRPGECYPR